LVERRSRVMGFRDPNVDLANDLKRRIGRSTKSESSAVQ